jgi:NADH-quinone oxidoreductase subunit L
MWVGLVGAALTAMYMTRATYLTFFGEPRGAAAGEHHGDELHAEEHEQAMATAGAQPRSLSAAATHGPDDHDDVHNDHGHDDAHDDHGHDDHGHDAHGPHESGPLLLVPIVVLAFFALTAGFLNATPLGEDWEQIKKYVEPRPNAVVVEDYLASGPGESVRLVDPRAAGAPSAEAGDDAVPTGCGFDAPEPGTACFFPAVSHATPTLGKILLSLGVVAIGYALAISFNVAFYGRRDRRLVGLTERSRALRGGYLFLKNKYYLDVLYENVIVRAVAHPIAKATNWTNQRVLDATVDRVGMGARKSGEWVYDNIDQRLVDGAVNGSGTAASELGHAMQPVQSGKVSQYGALLFGAAAVGAIVLVIVNVS